MDPSVEQKEHPQPHPHLIHIVVEVDGKNKPVTFDHTPVTGGEIREQSGAPTTDDLSRLVHGKPTGGNISVGDKVEIENGDQFVALPTGTVS
ncbi:MAG: hypothetical protein M3680_08315 [Myxococcota bacterium]|nr:hypothetical protein [Myxococcota bacterium]